MDQKETLRRYDMLVGAVKTAMGALGDEYQAEVGSIVPRVTKAADAAEVQKIVLEEFERWFGPGMIGPVVDYEAPARNIWQAVLKFRS